MESTKKLLAELGGEAMKMQTLAFEMESTGFKDTAKRLDADAVVLLKMQTRLMSALREDGVSLSD